MAPNRALAQDEQLTIEEFLAFTASRPQEERWELIEGVAVLNPSPIGTHQLVATNIVSLLMAHKRKTGAAWTPIFGIGTEVPISPRSLPQPDVIVQAGAVSDTHATADALVIFEVLSKSNTKADQAWRRKVYASVPNCQHYVTVALKRAEVVAFDRADGWKARAVREMDGEVCLGALGLALPPAEIYRWTSLDPGR